MKSINTLIVVLMLPVITMNIKIVKQHKIWLVCGRLDVHNNYVCRMNGPNQIRSKPDLDLKFRNIILKQNLKLELKI